MHIRFELRGGLLHRMYVVDDGRGMDSMDIEPAMTLGRPNTSAGQLGHFGVGLKSASFSQASFLTVLSRKAGCRPEGRRLSRERQSDEGFEWDVLEEGQVARALDGWPETLGFGASTVVRWDELREVPLAQSIDVTTAFIERSVVRLRHHLGLTFHRLLGDGKVIIGLDVYDYDSRSAGLSYFVDAINPVGYLCPGAPDDPKTLRATVGDDTVQMHCHIWPPGSDSAALQATGETCGAVSGVLLVQVRPSSGGWFLVRSVAGQSSSRPCPCRD